MVQVRLKRRWAILQQQKIHNFLERYFIANQCEILENAAGYLNVQLTIELDKLLMNRPFFWHYQEKIGGNPTPLKLGLITNQSLNDEKDGELIHFGSPRLHQIFRSTKKLAPYIRLYEDVKSNHTNIPLDPWLCINTKISYQCDRKKDHFLSLGLHLISGLIKENFYEQINGLKLTPKIPDFCFTTSPLIKPSSGLKRLEGYIESWIDQDDHSWAEEAISRWKEDQVLLDHFYEDEEDMPECYQVEKDALKTLYEPKINVDIINGGLFYLKRQKQNQ
jgi:hypothetical protein